MALQANWNWNVSNSSRTRLLSFIRVRIAQAGVNWDAVTDSHSVPSVGKLIYIYLSDKNNIMHPLEIRHADLISWSSRRARMNSPKWPEYVWIWSVEHQNAWFTVYVVVCRYFNGNLWWFSWIHRKTIADSLVKHVECFCNSDQSFAWKIKEENFKYGLPNNVFFRQHSSKDWIRWGLTVVSTSKLVGCTIKSKPH